MAIPSFPTDNLYKFIFIGGLTLCIGCLVLLATQANIILTEVDAGNLELVEMTARDTILKREISVLENAAELLVKKRARFDADSVDSYEQFKNVVRDAQNNKNYREYLDFTYRNRAFLLPYYAETEELNKNRKEIIDKTNERQVKSAMIGARSKVIFSHYSDLKYLLIYCTIFFLIGLYMLVKGYRLWYHNLQYYLDEKVRLEFEILEHQVAGIRKSQEKLD
ncbi:MAG: hypothetical protein V4539_16440 [Bacteroidota bacterium]